MRKLIILALGLSLVAAACNKQPAVNSASKDVRTGTVEIDISASSFNPANVTVKSGTTVVFKNLDSDPHWPASDPHPTHTDLPGFDALRRLTQGQTYAFTFMKLGTWGFHDHLSPTLRGSVTVVQ